MYQATNFSLQHMPPKYSLFGVYKQREKRVCYVLLTVARYNKPFFCLEGWKKMQEDAQVVVPVDVREMTVMETDKGEIHVISEITLGDLLITTSLLAILIFMVLSRVIRR
ncbi:hypothetical protein CHH49_18105 [Terribacillus saccharophilus]|nr:hypothetical protein CHH49_18105 [Terribacillus saccharophilus]